MRRSIVAVVAATVWCVAPTVAAVPNGTDQAEIPRRPLVPTMTISKNISLTTAQARLVAAGARAGGAVGHPVRFATVGLTEHTRDSRVLLSLRGAWRLPMHTKIASVEFFRAVGGDALAEVLARGDVVMGKTSASVRKARVGDVFTLRSRSFKAREFTVGAIVADEFVDSGDLAIATPEMSTRLGLPNISRVTITGIVTPARVLEGLRSRGVVPGSAWRLRASWDAPNPDGTLGLATVKKVFGEVTFRPSGGTSVLIDQEWALRNISWKRLYGSIPLLNNCHAVVAEALQKALDEIVAQGLRDKIDVQNTNRYGGCLTTRYNRFAGSFPGLSRHAFGMAVDLNPSTNQQWATPTIDCRVVRIMRKWGFAWGGNFWPADGMHFEWVGEPRHEWGYRSRFCPNPAPVPKVTFPATRKTTKITTTTVAPASTTTSSVPIVGTTSPPAETTTSVTSVP